MTINTITRVAVLTVCGLWLCVHNQAAEIPLVNIAGAAYGTRINADTEFSERYAGANVADGRTDSDACWFSRDSTPLPCALTMELSAEEDLRRVVLVQAKWQGNMYHTRDFAIETSADGKTWTRIATGTLPDESLARAEVVVQARTRWLRIVVLTSYNSVQTCGLAEVELLAAGHPGFGVPEIRFHQRPAPPPSDSFCGMSIVAAETGPQLAVFRPNSSLLVSVRSGEEVSVVVPILSVSGPFTVRAEATLTDGTAADVEISLEGVAAKRQWLTSEARTAILEVSAESNSASKAAEKKPAESRLTEKESASADFRSGVVDTEFDSVVKNVRLCLRTRAASGAAAVRWSDLRLTTSGRTLRIPVMLPPPAPTSGPPPVSPNLRPPLQRAMIEWDWKRQDGIGTERNPSTYPAAVARTLERGQRLIDDLRKTVLLSQAKNLNGGTLRFAQKDKGTAEEWLKNLIAQWEQLKRERDDLVTRQVNDAATWENLYLRLHWLRREIALQNPLLERISPLLFVKHVPSCFSHQLTQYYGRYARPGGGVFVLDKPGVSMDVRQLAPNALPMGSYMHPEVSYDGKRILFAFCKVDATPQDTIRGHYGRYYHLYEMNADGSGLRQITDGVYDDFAPRYLPDGKILFVSTRRGGWHRCGNPGCETYTLATAEADGSAPHPISFHETQEWDPAVLSDGRIIYTRWDYVDRHPVFYQQLWTTRPDGTAPAAFYGNNTFNPVGLWEAQPVPGSSRVMATAAAHHAMTAGSIILVDVKAGVDGPQSIVRLTPDAPFPESETPVSGRWFSPTQGVTPHETPESLRWPGHCYRSPYPLSETYFLAAYSFQALVGEPQGNPANMFGLYLVDAFGNKELLYRDPNISSLWPIPLRSRPRPPVLPSALDASLGNEGTFLLQDVYANYPNLPRGSIKRLRIVQVLPKSTPGIDNPPIGRPRGAPGKQVLGTVPVEPDGSAYFRVPAGIEVAFQMLDERGMAVQVMRSGTYVQPGEQATCVGCHEKRTTAPLRQPPQALSRPPSQITPGPDGSKPFSYPLLVQPILDKHCVSCHSGAKPGGGIALTGEAEGHYTVSYTANGHKVSFSTT